LTLEETALGYLSSVLPEGRATKNAKNMKEHCMLEHSNRLVFVATFRGGSPSSFDNPGSTFFGSDQRTAVIHWRP